MKKLIALAIVAIFATATFAQEPAAVEKKTEMKADTKMKHECYMMKDGVLMHHTGDKLEVMKTPVTLKNGTVISTTGEVKMKDGKTMKLDNGQCVSLMGGIGDYQKMHSSATEQKATEEKK